MTNHDAHAGGSTHSAIAPPLAGAAAAMLEAVERLQKLVDDAGGDSPARELANWAEFASMQRPSEEWVGAAVAFVLRAELRNIHHAAVGPDWSRQVVRRVAPQIDVKVRELIASREDVEAFISDACRRASCFVPRETEAQREADEAMIKDWRENVVLAVLYEVNEIHPEDDAGPLGIGVLDIHTVPRPEGPFWEHNTFGPLHIHNGGKTPVQTYSSSLLEDDRFGIAVIVPAMEHVDEQMLPALRGAIGAHLRDLAAAIETGAPVDQSKSVVAKGTD